MVASLLCSIVKMLDPITMIVKANKANYHIL